MTYQSEQQLEDDLIAQLSEQGFTRVVLKDNAALEANLKHQLEKVNNCKLSDTEFTQILGKLGKGNISLTKIYISGEDVNFVGYARTPDVVPNWIQSFENE